MTETTAHHTRQQRRERVLARLGDGAGPLLVVTAGMHGNEPAGVLAAERVTAYLSEHQLRLRGRALFLAGNLKALAAGERFIERDLNRTFDGDSIDAARHAKDPQAEQAELVELLAEIEDELLHRNQPHARVMLLDLHTASAQGPPFALCADTQANMELARALPLPLILGLEEGIDGTLLGWFGEHGHVALAVEGGQHDDPAAVDVHEAVLWITLVAAGLLNPSEAPEFASQKRLLKAACVGQPQGVAVRYRHPVGPSSEFRMEPGYANFARVPRGELLATDRSGEVRARFASCVLLPLYQGQGSDGFFLGVELSPRWFSLAHSARKFGLERILPLLPGFRRDPDRQGGVLTKPGRLSGWRRFLLELCGYRRVRPRESFVSYSRRPSGRG
ncbi:MAG: succinylglutamate desuccinylase/aspartoacylase family protein [Planctomycetota bacterium]|jgi:succinylglutamate desuccinylase